MMLVCSIPMSPPSHDCHQEQTDGWFLDIQPVALKLRSAFADKSIDLQPLYRCQLIDPVITLSMHSAKRDRDGMSFHILLPNFDLL